MNWTKYCKPENWHDAAKLFPLLDANGEDFKALVKDIRDNGLQNPVVLTDGKVLDGRNRLRACG